MSTIMMLTIWAPCRRELIVALGVAATFKRLSFTLLQALLIDRFLWFSFWMVWLIWSIIKVYVTDDLNNLHWPISTLEENINTAIDEGKLWFVLVIPHVLSYRKGYLLNQKITVIAKQLLFLCHIFHFFLLLFVMW